MESSFLTGDERPILMGYKEEAPHKLMRKKAEALLLLDREVPADVVAEFVNRKPSTLATWVKDWEESRMASIVTGHAENLNRSKLTQAQRDEVAFVLSQPPSAQALPGQFWTVPALKDWLQTRFDVIYESETSYHFLLKFAGLSFHKPEALDKRRADPKAIETRIQAIRDELVEPLADHDTLVFAADEVRLDQEAILRRAWYRKGQKTIVKVDRNKQSQSFIGFLNQNTGDCELHQLPWQNADEILTAVQALTVNHPGKKIVIVWDNAPWHKNKTIRAELAEGQTLSRVHLIAFPPYAPDHNPIEHVWNDAKNETSNIQRDTFDETVIAFRNQVRSRQYHYKI